MVPRYQRLVPHHLAAANSGNNENRVPFSVLNILLAMIGRIFASLKLLDFLGEYEQY
jgi:hypothetical protein